jgi:hypothetical protein
MKNYYILNYNETFLSTQIDLNQNQLDSWKTIKVNLNDSICDRGLKYIKDTRLMPMSLVNLFIGPPHVETEIHIDNSIQSYAINYVWGESNSVMRWYQANDNTIGKTEKTTAGTNFTKYDSDQVSLIEEVEIPKNKLTLVRIDIPHQVINYSNHPRYCLSIRFYARLNWHNIVRHVKHIESLELDSEKYIP